MERDFYLADAMMHLNTNKSAAALLKLKETMNKTQEMFKYTGLPTTIPEEELEILLQQTGSAFIMPHEDHLYAFRCSGDGDVDVYGRPTKYTVDNQALGIRGSFANGIDGVHIKNVTDQTPLSYKAAAYSAIYAESMVTLVNMMITARTPWLLSAGDEDSRESAELFIQSLIDGDLSVIETDSLFSEDSVKVHSLASGGKSVTEIVELVQYLKSDFYSDIGININENMKREYVSSDELAMNEGATKPLVDNMLSCRQRALDEVNALYNLDIKVELKSAWDGHKELLQDEVVEEDTTEVVEESEEVIETHSHAAEVEETLEGDLTSAEVKDTYRLLDGEDALTGELEEVDHEGKIRSNNAEEDVLEEAIDEEGEPEVDEAGGSDDVAEPLPEDDDDEGEEEVDDEKAKD